MRGAFLAAAAAVAGTAMADVAHMRRHGHDSFHHNRAYQPEVPAEGDENCECTTKVITITGPPTLVPINTPAPEPSSSSSEVPSVPSPSSESSVVTSEAVTTLHSTSTATVTVVTTPGVDATGAQTPTGGVPGTPEASSPAGTPEASTPVVPATSEAPLPTPGVTSFSSTGIYTIPATTVTVRDTTTVCGATTTELPSGTHTFGGVTTVVSTATTVTCPVATVEPSGSTVTSKIYTTTYVCPSAGTYTIAPTTTYVPTSTVVVYPTPATITPGTYTQDEQTVTVTRTDFTYVCPFTGNDQPTSAPVASTSAVPVTTTAAPSTTSAVASSSASSTATAVPTGVSGQQMGMTYSPYTNEGGCQSKDQVLKDVALIKQKGFTHVRVYSTDCNGLEYIGEAARQNGLKMIIGVFISSTGISGAQEQVTAITKWAQWDLVTLVVIGNEAIQNGYTDASSLAGFISSCKSSFQASGYSGQVTTTEPINVWQQSGSALCGAVDILGANLHPFFNADVTPDQAGSFVRAQIKDLEAVCNKDVINLETGWPSAGSANGKAVPGTAQQAAAIKALVEEVGSQSVFFSYSNDLWKDAGEFDVERYWGCIDQFK